MMGPFISTRVHSRYMYRYAQKNSLDTTLAVPKTYMKYMDNPRGIVQYLIKLHSI